MNQDFYSSHSQLDQVMTPEQFHQIVEAILAGKYSWACVLILRFAGYNPLHYIPYRTYNGGVKQMSQVTGIHADTIRRGRKELDQFLAARPVDRVRQVGGGRSQRKKTTSTKVQITNSVATSA